MVDDDEMGRVFNLGLGMVVVVAAAGVGAATAALSAAGVDPVPVGWVEKGERGVELTGPPLWEG
jgi:phosphoribosylaminoimidazole (AIR) synthetase